MKTLNKIAAQITGARIVKIKYGQNIGFDIIDANNNILLMVKPSFNTGFKWIVSNKSMQSLNFVNDLRQIKETIKEGFTGYIFKN